MAIFIYPALFFSSLGMIVGTCTMASDDELAGGFALSSPFYIAAIIGLTNLKNYKFNLFSIIPAIPIIIWHIYWYIGLFINTNINGKTSCTWKMSQDFGNRTSYTEYLYAPYFIAIMALITILLIMNYLKYKNPEYSNILTKSQKLNTIILLFIYFLFLLFMKIWM